MKKLTLLALLFAFTMFYVNEASGQRFIGYVSAGANFSQIEGDDVHGFTKFGANVGPGLMLPLNKKQTWTVSAELLYVQKGARKRYMGGFDTTNYSPLMYQDVNRAIPFDSTMKCNISLDYVQVPIMFHYEDMRSGCRIGVGFAWSRLVRSKVIYNGFQRTTTVASRPTSTNEYDWAFNSSDWTVVADAGIRLYKNLTLNLRYEYSLTPIRKQQFVYMKNDGSIEPELHKLYNHNLTLRLTYFINEKFERNTKTKNDGSLIGTKWVRIIQNN